MDFDSQEMSATPSRIFRPSYVPAWKVQFDVRHYDKSYLMEEDCEQKHTLAKTLFYVIAFVCRQEVFGNYSFHHGSYHQRIQD